MKSNRLQLVPAAGTAEPAPLTLIAVLGLILNWCFPRRPVGRSFILLTAFALAWIGTPPAGLAHERGQGLVANVVRPVHPILIRNQHGPLLCVMIDFTRRQTAQVASIEFSLDGTDDLNDIDSVQLFETGTQKAFSPATPVGKAVAPARAIVLPVDDWRAKEAFW